MVTWEELIELLPPFQDDVKLIVQDQGIEDIIRQVLRVHKKFAQDYLQICSKFSRTTVERTCRALFDFCVKNLNYKAEPIRTQTTMSPAAILLSDRVDCKHFANFCAGVLNALNRTEQAGIDWCFRFASYDRMFALMNPGVDPPIQHVFVVVFDGNGEIWIDAAPLPGNQARYFNDREAIPIYYEDKSVKMALYQISGFETTKIVSRNEINGCACENVGLIEDGLIQDEAPVYYESEGPITATPETSDSDAPFIPEPAPDLQTQLIVTVPLVTPPIPATTLKDMQHWLLVRNSEYNYSIVPGIEYYVDNKRLRFPGNGSRAALPPNLLVTYPAQWQGKEVPVDCPRPTVIGNRLCFLPKLGTWQYLIDEDYKLFKMCLYAMIPMIQNFSQFPDWKIGDTESYEHEGTLANVMLYDLDRHDVVDYVTSRPIVLPRAWDLPEGVRYISHNTDLVWPPDRQLNSVEFNRDNPPPPIPADLKVVYPGVYKGVKVPDILPTLGFDGGKLYLTNKDHMVDTDYRANNFLWYSFLVQTIAPLINAYAQFPYVGSNDQLAKRVWDDVIGVLPIENYLPPPEGKTWLGSVIETVGEFIHEVTMNSLKFVNAPMRLCFLGLVRINFAAFGYKLFWSLQNYEKRRKLYNTWRDIGGSIGELDEAIVLGCKNTPLWGGHSKKWIVDCVSSGEITYNCIRPPDDPDISDDYPTDLPHPTDPAWNDLYEQGKTPDLSVAGIGVVGADDVVYYLAAASTLIAALAEFLKGIGGPKTDKIVDDAVNGMNVILAAGGEDPIKLAAETGKPVSYTDPKTGKPMIIYPPDPVPKPGNSLWEMVKANPIESALVGGGIIALIYSLTPKKKPKRA
jgi:hypothetical protein